MSEQQVKVAEQKKGEAVSVLSPELLEQLTKPEVQESLAVLISNLPKIAEMLSGLANTYDTVQKLSKDPVFLDDVVGGFKDFMEPVQSKVKEVAVNAIEASEQAKSSTNQIGVFGLLRMLKDPQVQSALRFSEAFLALSNRSQNK